MDRQISLNLSSDVYDTLKMRAAQQGGRSVSSMVREILQRELNPVDRALDAPAAKQNDNEEEVA